MRLFAKVNKVKVVSVRPASHYGVGATVQDLSGWVTYSKACDLIHAWLPHTDGGVTLATRDRFGEYSPGHWGTKPSNPFSL